MYQGIAWMSRASGRICPVLSSRCRKATFDFHDGRGRAPSLNQLTAGGGDSLVVLGGTGKVEVGDSGQQASVEGGVVPYCFQNGALARATASRHERTKRVGSRASSRTTQPVVCGTSAGQ
jgi:hypothetical protein